MVVSGILALVIISVIIEDQSIPDDNPVMNRLDDIFFLLFWRLEPVKNQG
jgi:hypothetical protein